MTDLPSAAGVGLVSPRGGGAVSQAAWPTLREQLARDGVNPRSALVALIRENQDFDMLRPEEARDGLGLPPWLRVYWRKKHPEGTFSGADPTGGYPRVLLHIHKWMIRHQYLRPWRSSAQAVISRPDEEIIGSNVRISGSQIAPRNESDIRVNYQNPLQIIAAANASDLVGTQAQFHSSDGGRTWSQARLPLAAGTEDSLHSCPAVDWTSVGTAWAMTIGIDAAELTLQLRAYRSADGGGTWTFDGTVSGRQTAVDREAMWVDHSPTSPYQDTIYAIWHNNRPVYVGRRTGPGGTWQPPVQVSGPETPGTGVGGDIKTNSAGDVFAFWPDTISRRLLVAKSTDGGATFAAPVTVARTLGAYEIAVPSCASRGALIALSAGAYRTATKNYVYAVWVDMAGGAAQLAPPQAPGTDASSPCTSRIWFTRSGNGGLTWEPPRMINNQVTLNDQFNPRLAVDEATGQLLVVYYDTLNDPARRATDLWCQTSFDDGATWSVALRVTSAQTDETAAGADAGQYGDTIGLSTHGGTSWPSWTDRRGGGPEEIWTADIARVPEVATGSPLAGCTWGITQHVYYLGADGHAHELAWDQASGWRPTDLVTATAGGAPRAAARSALAAYTLGSTLHVFYQGGNGHVHELGWDPASGWRSADLMTATAGDAADAAMGSALAAYTIGITQHVHYLGADGHVHELWSDPVSGWRSADLMPPAAGAAPRAAAGSPLIGYTLGNRRHVFYLGADGHVHELWSDPASGWRPTDLMMAVAGDAAVAAAGSALMGFTLGGSQHVFYLGADRRVHELWWDPASGWHPSDLMTAAGGPPNAAAGSPLVGYTRGSFQHVFYLGADNHIHELRWTAVSGWHPSDLMAAPKGAALHAAAGSPLVGYVLDDIQHVFYLGTDGHIHELWCNPVNGWRSGHLVLAV